MSNSYYIPDDEASYLQQQIENEEYEYCICEQEKKERMQYLD
jgi:hypothetical protein